MTQQLQDFWGEKKVFYMDVFFFVSKWLNKYCNFFEDVESIFVFQWKICIVYSLPFQVIRFLPYSLSLSYLQLL